MTGAKSDRVNQRGRARPSVAGPWMMRPPERRASGQLTSPRQTSVMCRRLPVTVTATGWPGSSSHTSVSAEPITSHQSRVADGTSGNLNCTTVRPGGTAQEEIFGPIACVMRFRTEDEAVEIANGTAYGLTAAICTTDLVRADRLARRLEAGMVFVNNYMRRAFLGSPFGGVKGSGFGRENALETLHEFVRSKNIRFPSGRGAVPVWPPRDF